jgi:hypothetical protein
MFLIQLTKENVLIYSTLLADSMHLQFGVGKWGRGMKTFFKEDLVIKMCSYNKPL